jgi:uncharacterized membrane protein
MEQSPNYIPQGPVDFDLEKALKDAWENFKITPVKYVLMTVIFIAIVLVGVRTGAVVSSIISMITTPFFLMFFYGYAYQNSRMQFYPPFEIIFYNDRIPMLIILNVLSSLMTLAGISFFLIPGVIISICLIPAPLFLLFGGLGVFDSIRASFAYVFKSFGKFVLLTLLLIAVNIVGALMLGVGILISLPVSYIVIFNVYDQIVGAEKQF